MNTETEEKKKCEAIFERKRKKRQKTTKNAKRRARRSKRQKKKKGESLSFFFTFRNHTVGWELLGDLLSTPFFCTLVLSYRFFSCRFRVCFSLTDSAWGRNPSELRWCHCLGNPAMPLERAPCMEQPAALSSVLSFQLDRSTLDLNPFESILSRVQPFCWSLHSFWSHSNWMPGFQFFGLVFAFFGLMGFCWLKRPAFNVGRFQNPIMSMWSYRNLWTKIDESCRNSIWKLEPKNVSPEIRICINWTRERLADWGFK